MRQRFATLLVLCLALIILQGPALTAEDPDAPTQPFLKTKYGVSLYGYLKLDAAYDTNRVDIGNFARWVEPSENTDDNQFSMTANQTRLGLLWDTEDRHKVRTRARVEIDFYGDAPAENKPAVLLRHAFLELDWMKGKRKLLAGQTSDIIAPLVPDTVNYTVHWWVGNLGYRRPQIRYTRRFGDPVGFRTTVELGITRNIGHDDGFDTIDTGQDSGSPVFQGRMAVSGPMVSGRTGTVGFSGHWGPEEWELDDMGTKTDLESWSFNIDLNIPLSDWLTIQGEGFFGTNLDQYFGGIGQGVTVPAQGMPYEIQSRGGWLTFTADHHKKLRFNVGGGIDDPKDEDLLTGDRSSNLAVFGNTWWKLTPATRLGFEISYWQTGYIDEDDSDSTRLQTAFQFIF